jgi:hypothetical protein
VIVLHWQRQYCLGENLEAQCGVGQQTGIDEPEFKGKKRRRGYKLQE